MPTDLLWIGQSISAAVVGDGEVTLLDVNVGGAILPHGSQLHQLAVWPQLLVSPGKYFSNPRVPPKSQGALWRKDPMKNVPLVLNPVLLLQLGEPIKLTRDAESKGQQTI
jgi:hypothetical protein